MRTHPLIALFVLTSACGPGQPGDASDDTAANTQTTTADPGTSTTTPTTGDTLPTSTTGDTTDCGPAPPSPACTPDSPTDPFSPRCAMRTQAECDGQLDDGSVSCRWIATTTHPQGATSCAAQSNGGSCIALSYYGDGCEVPTTCGTDREGQVYFRTNAACETEVFFASFCGEAVLGWSTCAWSDPASDTCSLPHPTAGPDACRCACQSPRE